MKWFRLPAAAFLVALGLTAHADPYTPASGAPGAPSDAVPVGTGVDTDFPCYPPGFSSYRGLGFMGRCYEPLSPCAEHAWDGYCEGCYEAPPWRALFDKFQGWLHQPGWGCWPTVCEPCWAPGAKWWPVSSSCHEPLSLRLQRWRAQWSGKFGRGWTSTDCDGCDEAGQAFEPAADEFQEPAEPPPAPAVREVPAPATPATPAPQASGQIPPEFPPLLPARDRSAWRWFPLPLTGRQDGF